ncbi:histidinol dehydrogenase [Thermoproteota archaeon]
MPISIVDYNPGLISDLHEVKGEQDRLAITKTLEEIRVAIQAQGDQALIHYSRLYDKVEDLKFNCWVSPKEIKSAYKQVPSTFIDAVKKAKANIEWFHKQQMPVDWYAEKKDGSQYGLRYTAMERAGLYVPGGRAAYPSSVLMNVIPAQTAGVEDIIIATPPRRDGSIAPSILVAADICGIKKILKAGGAQAVFALAYGTQSVKKVDTIVGPGNIYVTLAKQMVYGQVNIDKPAGPSESLVYVNDKKYAVYAAAELLAQLEHDPDAVAVGVSEEASILKLIQTQIECQAKACSRWDVIEQAMQNSMLIQTKNKTQSIDAINAIASEHLVLLTDNYKKLIPKIKHAGAIFCGPYTPVAAGDYFAGPNHVLPTANAARFSSPLGVRDFMKASSVLVYSSANLKTAEPYIKALTEMEGFDAHYKSVMIRLQES